MILGLFSRELDASYLAHRAVLPIQNDSENLLINLFGDTISDLLHYSSVSETIQTQFLDEWIDQNINDEEFAVTETKKFNRTKELLKALMHSETENIETRFKSLFESSSLKNAEKKLYYESKSTELFLNVSQHGKKDRIDSEFAKLTHHKSLFLPKSIAPVLTLGTIIKSKTNENNYYVCIQQRCDSVRISNGDERKFLFLPLIKVDDERLFHFITQNGIKLRLDKKSYSIKTIKFKCNNSRGGIEAEEDSDGVFIYKENYDNGDTYEWQLDLKDLHSQRIVTDYATNLARVGLDESEWLRRAGNN